MSKLSQAAYEYIKERILSSEYPPGMRITEDLICTELGTSRTPVREAFQRLAGEQIITIYPNRYAEVTTFDKDRIRHIGAIRLALDMLSVYSCTYNGCVAEFDQLEELEQQYEAASNSGNVEERIRLECAFHLKIVQIAKNDDLMRQQQSLYQMIAMILRRQTLSDEDAAMQIQQHRDLIKAIRVQDTVTVRGLLCNHLRKTHGFSDNFVRYWIV